MAGLPPVPVMPVMPEVPGGTPGDSTGTPSADFPTIQHTHPLTMREFNPPSGGNVDSDIWQDEREIPPTPSRQDPDYELGWQGNASLPVPPMGGQMSPQTGGGNVQRGTSVDPDLRATITRVAGENGISPAYALATAERESSFNPNAGGTGTIKGLYQMSGALRKQYAIAPDADPEAQSQGFARFTRDLRAQMGGIMGRAPTDAETYLGHYFGGSRAARILNGQIPADTPVQDVFTPKELEGNPNIGRAGTVGNLARSTLGDMNRRLQRFQQAEPEQDFAAFGRGDGDVDLKVNRPGTEVDLAQYGI